MLQVMVGYFRGLTLRVDLPCDREPGNWPCQCKTRFAVRGIRVRSRLKLDKPFCSPQVHPTKCTRQGSPGQRLELPNVTSCIDRDISSGRGRFLFPSWSRMVVVHGASNGQPLIAASPPGANCPFYRGHTAGLQRDSAQSSVSEISRQEGGKGAEGRGGQIGLIVPE